MRGWKVATAAGLLTLQCLRAPRVTNHEIDSFLERGETHWVSTENVALFEAGPSTWITPKQVSNTAAPKQASCETQAVLPKRN